MLLGYRYGAMLEHPSHGLPDWLRGECCLPMAHLGNDPSLVGASQNSKANGAGQTSGPRCSQSSRQRACLARERLAQDPVEDWNFLVGELSRCADFRGHRPGCRRDRDGVFGYHQSCGRNDPCRISQRNPVVACQGFPRTQPYQARIYGFRAISLGW